MQGTRQAAVLSEESAATPSFEHRAASGISSNRVGPIGPTRSSGSSRPANHQDENIALRHRSLSPSFQERSLCFFIDQYYYAPSEAGNPGWLEFLPELYLSCNDGSCFKSAVLGVATVNLANQSSLPSLSEEAYWNYRLAIKALRDALSRPDEAVKDETLASILLICLFAVSASRLRDLRLLY